MTLGAPTWFWLTVAALLGLTFGSFFTVVVSRWPAEQSLVRPPSHCTTCDRRLSWFELVPVLSWLALRGRCRGCSEKVSPRYLLIELATAVAAVTGLVAFGVTIPGVLASVLLVALVPVVVIDLEHKLIPDNVVVYPATIVALTLAIAHNPQRWWVPVVAAVSAAGFLLALILIYPGGMGMGDVKLALLLGAVLGSAVIPAIAIAFLTGSILGVVMIMKAGKAARKMAIPFGPFLAAGAVVSLWWGPTMLDWYSQRLS